MNRHARRGFSLIELLVVIAIIAIMMAIAVPSFGSSVRASRERTAIQRLTQDFMWARGASASNDASTLLAGTSGTPTLKVKVFSDCSWITTVNNVQDPKHTVDSTAIASIAPNVSCAVSGTTMPVTFQFTSQGFVSPTGKLTFTGTAYQSANSQNQFVFQILYSGAMFRAASSAS